MKQADLVSARDMARAVSGDAQFRPPTRPRFVPELVVVPLHDHVLVVGADEPQVFRGPAATTLLPRLIPLLDGTRELEDLAAALPEAKADALRNAIALLYTRGLLEEGADEPHPGAPGTHPEAAGFYRRHVDTTRANSSVAALLRRLAGARAWIAAAGPRAERFLPHLRQGLHEGGVGTVMLVPAGRIPPRVAAVEIGVVLAEAGADLSALDERFAAAGVPWLHASIDVTAGTALLGPYFDPHHTLCYPCFRAGAAAAVPPSSEGEGEEEALAARTLADLLTMQALYALGSTAPLAVGQTCTRYRIDEWTAEEDAVAARLPDCPRCSSAVQSPPPTSAAAERVEPDPALVLAAAYEDLAGFPAYQVTPKAHQAHYRVQNIALTGEAKHYRCASHVALPAADPLSALTASREPTRRMGVDELALLLRLVGGVRAFPEAGGGKLRRWAPTGGNLGSVELYVVVNDVVGVEPGSWYYDPHLHALARLHERSDGGQAPFPRHLASAGDELAAAVLVLGAAYHRVARKYGPRAYRIVHLDAGVALAQLDAVAAALGIGVEVAEGFDEEAAARWLDLSPPMEMVTAMVALAPGPRAAGKTTSELDLEMEAVPC